MITNLPHTIIAKKHHYNFHIKFFCGDSCVIDNDSAEFVY